MESSSWCTWGWRQSSSELEGGIVDPVQEDEPVERSGKRTHQVQIANTVTRQVLLARQKPKPGKLWSDTG